MSTSIDSGRASVIRLVYHPFCVAPCAPVQGKRTLVHRRWHPIRDMLGAQHEELQPQPSFDPELAGRWLLIIAALHSTA